MSFAATQSLDKLPYPTEPGLQVWSLRTGSLDAVRSFCLTTKKECEVLKKLILVSVLFLLLLSGCTTAETDSQPEEPIMMYQKLALPDLIISIPENYQTTSSKAYEEYYICEDASIIITEDTAQPYYSSAYDYAVSALNEYEKITSSLEFLGNETLDSGCDYKIQTMEFNYTLGEGEQRPALTCLVGYLTDSASMYIITCKSNTETYSSHREEFRQVLQSAVIARGKE